MCDIYKDSRPDNIILCKKCVLKDIGCNKTEASETAVAFSTFTSDGMPYVLKAGGNGLWARTATENILSLPTYY
eukprot:3192952-Rhodomonas_salina.3